MWTSPKILRSTRSTLEWYTRVVDFSTLTYFSNAVDQAIDENWELLSLSGIVPKGPGVRRRRICAFVRHSKLSAQIWRTSCACVSPLTQSDEQLIKTCLYKSDMNLTLNRQSVFNYFRTRSTLSSPRDVDGRSERAPSVTFYPASLEHLVLSFRLWSWEAIFPESSLKYSKSFQRRLLLSSTQNWIDDREIDFDLDEVTL